MRAPIAERRTIGSTGVRVTAVSLGAAGLSPGDSQAEATEAIDAAFHAGIRYFDVAPYYGLGQSEIALGSALAGRDRASFTLSTKVGRTVDPDTRQWSFDYSRGAVLAGLESSLRRLNVDRVDIVYVHDPDSHERAAADEAIPALLDLKEQGVIGAVGIGMNQTAIPARLVREFELDAVLIAGRYTLLDASADDELFPLCTARGVAVVLAGIFNSGILANPRDGARYDYRPAPVELLERARAIEGVAARYDVSLRDVALAFSAAHPVVTSVLLGASSARQVRDNIASWDCHIPSPLWADLEEQGLLPVGAPGSR